MERKQYIRIEQVRRPEPLTEEEKIARILDRAKKMQIKLGGPDGDNERKTNKQA